MNLQRTNCRKYHRNAQLTGFTLIELLVVLVILGLLASVTGPRVMKYLGDSKSKTSRLQVEDFAAAVDLYNLDTGKYPTTEQGLQALVEQPGGVDTWNGPYLRKKQIPKDPWGYHYHYEYPNETGEYALFSLGSDNSPGGEGEARDINGWE